MTPTSTASSIPSKKIFPSYVNPANGKLVTMVDPDQDLLEQIEDEGWTLIESQTYWIN